MQTPFTTFVRLLDGSPNAPSQEAFGRLWNALRAAMVRELKRRHLWHLPPSYLGVEGSTSWLGEQVGAVGGPGDREDALEELTVDCYSYIFLTRLDSLRAQLKLKPNVEGLVLLSIRSFLLERQRHCDPVGSRVYEVLRSAVRRAVTEEIYAIQEGDRRIRNDTVLAARRVAAGGPDAETLAAEVAREWADDLLPDLVTAAGRARRKVEDRILDRLARLPERGLTRWRFGTLLDSLKVEVRARWRAIFHRTLGEVAAEPDEDATRLVLVAQPDTSSFEDRQYFAALAARVTREVDRLDADSATISYLSRLWGFLRAYALDTHELQCPPSRRRIAKELRIPRDRLPGLYATLGELIRGASADRPAADRLVG